MIANTPTMPILMIGLNHKVAPVEVRERLAFGPERVPVVLKELLCGETGIQEAVLLSTCNRTEVYLYTCDPGVGEAKLYDFFAGHAKLSQEHLHKMCVTTQPAGAEENRKMGCVGAYAPTHPIFRDSITRPEQIQMFYMFHGREAAGHLMEVAAGLDSLVLGENEILGQVRTAADMAHAAGATGPVLSALFRYAVRAGKRARTETEIGRGQISVASVVVELAGQAFGPLHDRTALLIGAGKISSITARCLVKAGLRCILIANRTFEKAQKLAQTLNGTAVRFDALDEVLAKADIVICSTGAPHVVLHAETVAKAQRARGDRPLLVADLAVPRDADPQIGCIPGVKLADIDDLDTIVKTGHLLTASVCQEVQAIVCQELDDFCRWCEARRCAPVIRALQTKADAIYQAEVEQTLRRLGPLTPHQQRLIQAMGKAIAGKLLHEPIAHLRGSSPNEDLFSYLELVQELYNIQ